MLEGTGCKCCDEIRNNGDRRSKNNPRYSGIKNYWNEPPPPPPQ